MNNETFSKAHIRDSFKILNSKTILNARFSLLAPLHMVLQSVKSVFKSAKSAVQKPL